MSEHFGVILTNRSAVGRPARDFYPTPPACTVALLNLGIIKGCVWEPAHGTGAITSVLRGHGHQVATSDIDTGTDFLTASLPESVDWIVTNPPFNLADEFVRAALKFPVGVAFLLKSQFWHAAKREPLFHTRTPIGVYPLTWRPDFLEGAKGGAPTMEMAWTVWGPAAAPTCEYRPLRRESPTAKGADRE